MDENITIKFSELRKLCFCNSNELMDKVFLIDGKHYEWVGIGMAECDPDPERQTIRIVD